MGSFASLRKHKVQPETPAGGRDQNLLNHVLHLLILKKSKHKHTHTHTQGYWMYAQDITLKESCYCASMIYNPICNVHSALPLYRPKEGNKDKYCSHPRLVNFVLVRKNDVRTCKENG